MSGEIATMRLLGLNQILWVGAGGFLGAVMRYVLAGWIDRGAAVSLPLGTLVVNLLGCFAIGVLGALADAREILTPEARQFLSVGILGGFTTFSSFAYESLVLTQAGQAGRALGYAVVSVVLGFAAAWLGYAIFR